MFTTALQNAPSIVVLENLDVLAHATGEQATHDGEYFNHLSDTVHQLIVQYTYDHPIVVIATINELQSLNKRLYSPRGRHLFQTVAKLPNLERNDRQIILHDLCQHIESEKLDLEKFALLTEGYNKGDLVQFVERAIFYAYRISKSVSLLLHILVQEIFLFTGKTNPILTNQHLVDSLENTNSYCLQGITSNQLKNSANDSDEMTVEEIPGLQPVVTVLEEVLMWPSKVNIF